MVGEGAASTLTPPEALKAVCRKPHILFRSYEGAPGARIQGVRRVLGAWDSGFRDLGFRDLGFRAWGLGVQGLGFRVVGFSGFRDLGIYRVLGLWGFRGSGLGVQDLGV